VTAIEASCAECGVVLLSPAEIEVRVCVDLRTSAYTFRCPECGLPAAKSANERVVEFLTSIGASLEVWYLPEELREPHPGGDPLSYDDLLDFHILLQDKDWFSALEELVARRPRRSPLAKERRSRSFRRGPRA
jgi:hypothetical protein